MNGRSGGMETQLLIGTGITVMPVPLFVCLNHPAKRAAEQYLQIRTSGMVYPLTTDHDCGILVLDRSSTKRPEQYF